MNDDAIRSPYWALRLTFGLIPIVAGIDKFFNLITYWPKYIAPEVPKKCRAALSASMLAGDCTP